MVSTLPFEHGDFGGFAQDGSPLDPQPWEVFVEAVMAARRSDPNPTCVYRATHRNHPEVTAEVWINCALPNPPLSGRLHGIEVRGTLLLIWLDDVAQALQSISMALAVMRGDVRWKNKSTT